MDSQASKDAAAKQRIVSHMNNDHHDSVVRYLEYYHKLPGYQAYGGSISDITLATLSFSCQGKTYQTPFEPPMTSYREARERVVEMDKECLAGLGRSDITVTKYISPHGAYLVSFVVISITFIAYSTRANFEDGGYLAAIVPSVFARFSRTIQPFVFYPMLAIHSAEAYHMARGRLAKHSVNVRSKVWWQWLGTTFIEGVGSFSRFDKMIQREKEAKEKQKH